MNEMADSSSSDSIRVNSVPSEPNVTASDGEERDIDINEPDRRFVVRRKLNISVSLNTEGTVKPRLIRQFIRWLRKVK